MYDTKIRIIEVSNKRDAYNERIEEEREVAICYSQKTESGGRENLYASRIVHENEIVYTVRWRSGIKAGQFVLRNGNKEKITSVHEEGRRYLLHIKTIKNDVD